MANLKIDYVEFGTSDIGASREFFTKAFGWQYTDYGPEYCAINNGGIDGGLDGTDSSTKVPLVILKADDLESALQRVEAAGGAVVEKIFSFPGGRRFHFKEPGGNVLAVWSKN